MAAVRRAEVTWEGDLAHGSGKLSAASSGAFSELPVTWGSRIERADGRTSPEELLAAALASCTAITMEMYADRKGWDLSGLEVDCNYTPADRGCPTAFNLVMRLPDHLTNEQVERLSVIAAKCPIHRTLESEVSFNERFERVSRV